MTSSESPAGGERVIRVSAVVMRDQRGRVLNVRKRGTTSLMLPGGKHEPGEDPSDTAVREFGEELGIALDRARLRSLGVFRAAAANEPDHVVEATVFEHPFVAGADAAEPLAEIAALEWVDPTVSRPDMAPLNTDVIFPVLRDLPAGPGARAHGAAEPGLTPHAVAGDTEPTRAEPQSTASRGAVPRGASPAPAGPGARPGPVFTVGRAILRPLLRLRFRPVITGEEHVPATGPVLLASNHLAGLDTILIPSFSPRKVQFLAKASLFTSRIGAWFFPRIGAIPVHREASAAAQAALEAGREVLAAGNVFAVFPEGSRSRDGRLYRGRGGAAWLALETGATVVPVGLIGTNRTLRDPATGRAPRVELRFGAPVRFDDLAGLPAGKARREATERIMTAIQSLTGQETATDHASGGRGA